MYSGNSKTINVTILDKLNKPVNLTGATLVWVLQLRGKTIVTKTTDDGISIVDASMGKISMKLDPIDTYSTIGDCQHELQIVTSTDTITLLTGVATLIASIVPITNVITTLYGGLFSDRTFTMIVDGGSFSNPPTTVIDGGGFK
jgi:hypothetical protein